MIAALAQVFEEFERPPGGSEVEGHDQALAGR
jgi:hypothetical protein